MKHKSFFTLLAAALMTMSAWAIGPQSLKVTFDGTDNANWKATVNASHQQVANGIISVTQELQPNNLYRADIKFNEGNNGANTFMLNPDKDKFVAIKFIGSRPGGSLKFEFRHDDQQWCNLKWNGGDPSSVDATDGKVYYFNLTADDNYNSGHLDADGNFKVRQMNFTIADNPDSEANTYQVDWIATFESLEDIKAWVNWNDEIASDSKYPVAEFGYRIKTDNSWDSSTPKNGWSNAALEARYGSRLFTIMLFQIENFQSNAVYTLSLHKGDGGAGELGVWNFPHADIPVVSSQSAATLAGYAKAVTGVGMDMTGEKINPITTSTCNANVWTFSLPGTQLTPISTDANGISLVGLLVTTPDLTNDKVGNAHIATCGNTTAANYPTLEKTGSYAVINTTKMVGYATLVDAVNAAEHNDVLEIYENVELGACINTNDRALTIQGHTGTEVITRKAGYTGLMFLTTNNENAALTVRNLIVDGNNVETSLQVFESSNSTKMTTLENVTVRNVKNSNDFGSVISNKNGGALTLNNVTFQDITCTATSTPSVIFVGTYHVTLKGNNQFINCGEVPAIRVENKYYMSAEGELTNTTPIAIQLGTHIDGNSVVKSCTDKSKFALVNTPFVLANVEGNLVAKDYILMNTTQDLGYNTFADAIAAAEDGDVIEIRKDITTPSGRTDIAKAITFKAVNGAVIYNGTSDNNMLFLSTTATGVTFEDVIIDGAGKDRADVATMEAGSGYKLILKNVTVRNLTSGRDVTVNGFVDLYGNNVLPNGIRLNHYKYVTDHETTHTTPIYFSLANDYEENGDAVHGTTDYDRYSASKNGVEWETYADTEHNQVRVRSIAVPLTYDLTVTAAGKATLVLGFNVPSLPTGVEAYNLTNDGSNEILATEITALTANEPVLIIAEEGTYTFKSEAGAVLNEAANPTNGCLIGTYTDIISIDLTTGDHHNYILASGDAGVGFYQVLKAGYSINSHHAYLSCGYNASAGASHAPMRIRFSTETATDIHSAATDSSIEKLLINGVLYIRKADHIYSIDGMMIR